MRYQLLGSVFIALLFTFSVITSQAQTQSDEESKTTPPPQILTMVHAVMCEEIKDFAPNGEAIVFSSSIGKVNCFSAFDPVPEKTYIFHKWFYEDKLSSQKKLTLKPPKWATFSSIQLREADKGPWRVEITNPDGKIFQILRFSILD